MDQSHAPPMHNDMPDGGAYGFYGGADGEHNPPFGVYQDSMNGYGGMVNPNMPPRGSPRPCPRLVPASLITVRRQGTCRRT
jgi:hypothetical protein